MSFQLNDNYEERAAIIEHDGQSDPRNALLDFKRGTVLFCGDECHIKDAKEYIRDNKFTPDQVELVKRGDKVMVIMK